MKTKKFYLNLDGDVLPFYEIMLDENNNIPEGRIKKDYALSNNPTIIDISNLSYTPHPDSVWNGNDFISENTEIRPPCSLSCLSGCASFAFVINNIYHGMNGYCLGIGSDAIIAALQSNPTITYEVVDI